MKVELTVDFDEAAAAVSHIQNFGDLPGRCRISRGRRGTRTREMRSSATGDVLSL